jgi:glycosyltransferase involved in cell wall biosynthesis
LALLNAWPVDIPSDYPKILVVARMPFNTQDGTGIALSSLFHDWPKERIAQLCGQSGQVIPDRDICETYYRLGAAELPRAFPLSLVDRFRANATEFPAPVVPSTAGQARRSGGVARPSQLKARLGQMLHARGWLYPVDSRMSGGLKNFLDAFAPDLIFAVPAEYAFVRLTRQIGDYLGIPIAVQVYDNWMMMHYRKGPRADQKRRRLDRELRALFDRAAIRFGISRVMCEAYEAAYSHPFLPLSVAVDTSLWHRPLRERKQTAGRRRILYAGTIHQHAAYAGLADMSRAVAALNHAGVAANFSIVSPNAASGKQMADIGGEFTEFVHEPDRRELINRVGSADLLFLPVAFDAVSRQFVKYSMPAKCAAYMASGTPMLVYAPAEFPISIEATRHGFAHVVSEPDIGQLTAALRHMLTDAPYRAALSESAVRHAKENYDMETVSRRIRGNFCDAILQNNAERKAGAVSS